MDGWGGVEREGWREGWEVGEGGVDGARRRGGSERCGAVMTGSTI